MHPSVQNIEPKLVHDHVGLIQEDQFAREVVQDDEPQFDDEHQEQLQHEKALEITNSQKTKKEGQ